MSDPAAFLRARLGSGNPFRRPDSTWSCTRDGVTEPCGDCDGCRYVAAENAAHNCRFEYCTAPTGECPNPE